MQLNETGEHREICVHGFSPVESTGMRSSDYGLFLQCMADNTHADRKTFGGVIKLLQRIHDGVEGNDSIQALLLEFWGSPITGGHVS